MKIPDRVIGNLELNNIKYSFEFDKDRFKLKLYHIEEENEYEMISGELKCFGVSLKEHKWVDKITIEGRTSEGYLIYFGVLDSPSSYNGYLTYNVNWYYVTNDDTDLVDEVRFFGRDIDCFYNPSRVFQKEIKYKEQKYLQVDSISVQTVDSEALGGGSYISDDVSMEISCDSYAIIHPEETLPLESKSYLKLKFSKKIKLNTMFNEAGSVLKLFKYVNYRTNINIDDISTYIANENGKIRNCGKLVFKKRHEVERNEKAKDCIIKAEYLNNHVAEILKAIDSGEISFGHFCNSYEERSQYPISRIIMILAAFEREFRNIYGQDAIRSKAYKDTKEQIVKLIEDQAPNYTGDRKKYIKGFAKIISNIDSSYGDNLEYALKDCKDIMEPFVIRRFEGTYEEIIADISISVNKLRNGVAHSRLDLELKPRHLVDIKLVEEMIYVIRLKKIGIVESTIKKSINELFSENLDL